MMKIFQKQPSTNQRGAVMMLLVLLLVPILLAIAMVIDTSRLTSSDSELERVANSMALGALEAYLRTDGPNTRRANSAKNRAVEIASLSSNDLLAAADNEFSASDFSDPDRATIDFGTWFFEEPSVGCGSNPAPPSPCPCSNGAFAGPCFQGGVTDPFQVNAARMQIRTQSNIITSAIGSLMNFNPIQLNASSTVAAVPRNGVFLIDLSRSTQFQTHLPFEQQTTPTARARASEFAFRLAPDIDGQPGSGFTCADLTSTCQNLPHAKLEAYCNHLFPPLPSGVPLTPADIQARADCRTECPPITPFPAHQAWHNSMTNSGPTADVTKHYRNAYQCVAITPPGPGSTQENYLVEKNQSKERRPEPLATILGGINTALKTVKERSIAGDTVTLIGFDGQIFESNPGNTIRTYGPTSIGTPEFNKIFNLTDPDTANFDDIIPEFLFPGAGPNRGETDISGALISARDLLRAQPNFNVARNFVVLFSDGLSSCYHGNAAPNNANGCMFSAGKLSQTRCLAPSPANIQLSKYDSGYNVHRYGLKEATQVISKQDSLSATLDPQNRHAMPTGTNSCGGSGNQESYVELGIKFHYFAIGEDVNPFSLSFSNAAATDCASEEELLDMTLDSAPLQYQNALFTKLVKGSCSSLSGATTPETIALRAACNGAGNYGQSHQDLYNFGVYQTRGVYAPIRPACDPSISGSANVDAMKVKFTDNCKAAGSKAPASQPGYTFEESATRKLLTCDPEGLTPAEQIEKNIQNIYGDNPFIIVE